MPNPARVRLYYDEGEARTEDEMTGELEQALQELDGIMSVSIELAFAARPPEAEAVVEFDEAETAPEELQLNASQLPFIHNARIVE